MKIKNLVRILLFSYIFANAGFLTQYSVSSKENQNEIYLQNKELTIDYLNKNKNNYYILGPGDLLEINLSNNYPNLKKEVLVDGEGTIFLPRINRIYVKGLTLNELNDLINEAFSKYLKFPNLEVTLKQYRPVTFFTKGGVNNPGLHSLEGKLGLNFFPTVFDAIKQSDGFTRNADFSQVEIVRINSVSNGGGMIKTVLNFNDVFKGDISQNIRIYDGDLIFVKSRENIDKKNLELALESNIYPDSIDVFINGQINKDGTVKLPFNTSLNQAILISGGKGLGSGKITHITFNKNGTYLSKKIKYSEKSKPGSLKNPILKNKDIIYLDDGAFIKTSKFLNLITSPLSSIISSYGLYKILNE